MGFPSGAPLAVRRLSAWLAKFADRLSTNAVTVALAAGSANVMGITITVTDEDGAVVPGVHQLEVYASEASNGLGITGDTYSGDLAATAGFILGSLTAKKRWTVLTAATGIFTGTLTDTAKPQDQFIVVKNPLGSGITVSVVSAGKFG